MVPAWLRLAKPSGNAVLAYVTLASYGTFDTDAGVYEECRPRLSVMMVDSGMSESTLKRALSELLKLGAVERTERWAEDGKTRLPSIYRVIFGSIVGPTGFTGGPTPGVTDDPTLGPPVTYNQEPSTQNPPTKKPSASQRGTRLPEDWVPSDALLKWFLDECVAGGRWSAASREPLQRQQRIFVDHWLSTPGARGRKVDWDRTWKNWMRKSFPRPIGTGGPAPAAAGQYQTAAERNAERLEERQRKDEAIDALMEANPGMTATAAARAIDADLANRLAARTDGAYIDVEIVPGKAALEVSAT